MQNPVMSQPRSSSVQFRCRTAIAYQRPSRACLAIVALSLALATPDRAVAEGSALPWSRPLAARDSLNVGTEDSTDARGCLDGLCWSPAEFTVDCQTDYPGEGDALITFPSPVTTGNESNDRVVLEWFVARDLEDRPVQARAVVVVHESGSRMTVGKLIAANLRAQGLHAFLLHLPYYGERRQEQRRPDGANILPAIRQAVADVRRARDAVAVLPLVDDAHIALQGTSLGGIISATTAGLDRKYDSVHLFLAGGDLYGVLQNGQRDAAKFREELQRAGMTDEKLREVAYAVEPLRLGHRVNPARVWLYTANFDQVIPPPNSDRLAEAMRIDPSHRITMAADHYTGIIYLPFLLKELATQVKTAPPAPRD
jgi:dienelactone hydrolase